MAITIALSSRPFNPSALTGTGVVAGQTLAVPTRTGKISCLGVSLLPASDPGASQFTLDVSQDGTNWTVFDQIDVPDATQVAKAYPNFAFPFVRISQVSKTNSVSVQPTVTLD